MKCIQTQSLNNKYNFNQYPTLFPDFFCSISTLCIECKCHNYRYRKRQSAYGHNQFGYTWLLNFRNTTIIYRNNTCEFDVSPQFYTSDVHIS